MNISRILVFSSINLQCILYLYILFFYSVVIPIKVIDIMEPAFFFRYLNTFDDYIYRPNGWVILIAKIVFSNMSMHAIGGTRFLKIQDIKHVLASQFNCWKLDSYQMDYQSFTDTHTFVSSHTLQKYLIYCIKILHDTYISTCVLQHYKFIFDFSEYVINYRVTTNIDWI